MQMNHGQEQSNAKMAVTHLKDSKDIKKSNVFFRYDTEGDVKCKRTSQQLLKAP